MAPVTMAKARVQLDRLAQARRALRPGGQQLPVYCKRAADLWSAEARVWTTITAAADFPLGTASGALLAQAAGYAARYADARATSWLMSGGSEQIPAEQP